MTLKPTSHSAQDFFLDSSLIDGFLWMEVVSTNFLLQRGPGNSFCWVFGHFLCLNSNHGSRSLPQGPIRTSFLLSPATKTAVTLLSPLSPWGGSEHTSFFLFCFVFKIVVKHTHHKYLHLPRCQVCSSAARSTFTVLCSHHHHRPPELCHQLIEHQLSISHPLPRPLATTLLCSVCVNSIL